MQCISNPTTSRCLASLPHVDQKTLQIMTCSLELDWDCPAEVLIFSNWLARSRGQQRTPLPLVQFHSPSRVFGCFLEETHRHGLEQRWQGRFLGALMGQIKLLLLTFLGTLHCCMTDILQTDHFQFAVIVRFFGFFTFLIGNCLGDTSRSFGPIGRIPEFKRRSQGRYSFNSFIMFYFTTWARVERLHHLLKASFAFPAYSALFNQIIIHLRPNLSKDLHCWPTNIEDPVQANWWNASSRKYP